ncbi:MAG: hypothetical protein K0S83_503 [Thermomicrobiales bacterium]|nr:hypothetical protein [Thermomicrobiales bacterium]
MTGPFAFVVSETPSHDVTETTLTRFSGFPRIEVSARFAQISEIYVGSECPPLPRIDPLSGLRIWTARP